MEIKALDDSSIGLYNTITNTFYSSNSSSNFVAGEYSGFYESTQDDYDFYVDIPTYKLPKLENKYYGINQ